MVPASVAGRHTDDLVVAAGLVDHPEHPDRPGFDEHAGMNGLREQHQCVEGVAILTQGVLDEPVIGRIAHRRVQVAVQTQAAGHVVNLVLVALALGNLDRDVELHRALLHR